MYTRILLSFIASAALCLTAQAQTTYKWKDAQGRTVYSDQPPPESVPSGDIVRGYKPKISAPPATTSGEPVAEDTAKPAAEGKPAEKKYQPKSTAEQEMEFKKRQQEKTEAEEKKKKAQAEEKQRQEFCESSKGYLRALEDGVRIAQNTASGEKSYLDDDKRKHEIDDLKKQMRENKCN
ncbi:MAG: DUF4124 domain-containing protein [Burkholderiaceae bacterium]|nr:MAG: DUF4124 domain-containing protein [Burkholderiaceae bacterium]